MEVTNNAVLSLLPASSEVAMTAADVARHLMLPYPSVYGILVRLYVRRKVEKRRGHHKVYWWRLRETSCLHLTLRSILSTGRSSILYECVCGKSLVLYADGTRREVVKYEAR